MKYRRIATYFVAAALMVSPASAQLDVDLGGGLDADVDLGTSVQIGDPYTYRGYRSGRWYYSDFERSQRYYDRYGGYDCHEGFRYGWENGRRVRYESWWCYDDNGERYQVKSTRATVRVD